MSSCAAPSRGVRRDDVGGGTPATPSRAPRESPGETLSFFNGYGGFTVDGLNIGSSCQRSRQSRLSSLPPAPWSNVVANPNLRLCRPESGSQFMSENSYSNRLIHGTTIRGDPAGEVIYLRDEQTARVLEHHGEPAGRGVPFAPVRPGLLLRARTHQAARRADGICCRGRSVQVFRLRIRNLHRKTPLERHLLC